MNITIGDIDGYCGKSKMPNVDCMKLSSYHKQRGDSINFVTDKSQLTLSFDRMYIARISDDTEVPSKKLLNDNRVMLLGKGFRYYGAKSINAIVASCRPDYLLYNIDEKNPYSNANFVQFYCGKTLLKQRQDFHNTFKHHKKTIVVDNYFGKATEEEINYCLDVLKEEKNIAFLNPIWLDKIINNSLVRQKFLALNFTKGTLFKWKNNLPLEAASTILDFMEELRVNTSSTLGFVPFEVELFGTDEDEALLAQCFQIIDVYKRHKISCVFEFNGASRFKMLADCITNGTQRNITLSYIEHATHWQSYTEGISIETILGESLKWHDPGVDGLLYLLTSPVGENIRPCLYRKGGEDKLDTLNINFEKIKPLMNRLFTGVEE